MTELFPKPSRGAGGPITPFLSWHPRPTIKDGITANSWSVRDKEAGRKQFDGPETTGMVVDLLAMRSGWEQSSGRKGVVPARRWNKSSAAPDPRPGDDWKQAISVVVVCDGERMVWEQSGVAACTALFGLVDDIWEQAVQQRPKLPHVRCIGHRDLSEATWVGDTSAPIFELVGWVARPAILETGAVSSAPARATPTATPTDKRTREATAAKAGTAAGAKRMAKAADGDLEGDAISF